MNNKKNPTINNHYISKVFLKSWLRPNQSQRKDTLLAFFLNSQKLENDIGRNVSFAAEDFLYSIKTEDGIDDSFEEYLQEGENAWGQLLNNLKNQKLFNDDDHFESCIFLLVSFYYRTSRNFKIYEKMLKKSVQDISHVECKSAVLNLIHESIENRVTDLLNRKIVIFENDADIFMTSENPFFDLKFSKFKTDTALCALTPKHLMFISNESVQTPTIIHKKLNNDSKFPHFWNNEIVAKTSRKWVVAVDSEDNKSFMLQNLTLEKVKQYEITDKVLMIIDGETVEVLISEIETD